MLPNVFFRSSHVHLKTLLSFVEDKPKLKLGEVLIWPVFEISKIKKIEFIFPIVDCQPTISFLNVLNLTQEAK